MTKKNTKADGTEMVVEIPVVAPINMGKGFKWDSATKTYQVSISPQNSRIGSGLEIGPNGAVNVALSKDPTNLLQMKPDGVYYGVKPPANIGNLYVDALNGVDQHPDEVEGAGTSSKPLRTLRYANSLARQGTTRTISLRANQDHIVDANALFDVVSGVLNIHVYGAEVSEAYDAADGDFGNAMLALLKSNKEARLVFKGVKTKPYPPKTKAYTIADARVINVMAGAKVSFVGVRLVNDVNFMLAKESEVTSTNLSIASYNRIMIGIDSVVGLTHCRIDGMGTVTTGSDVTGVKSEYLTTNNRGVQQSTFGLFNLSIGTLSFDNVYMDETLAYSICGNNGWYNGLSAGASISLRNVKHTTPQQLAKRILGVQVEDQNGVKLLTNLVSDVSATLFV